MAANLLNNIKLVITDVDGVLSDGKVYYTNSGDEIKNFNIKDGLGIKLLQKIGIPTAIITGRESKIVARRAAELGIEHVFQGKKNKVACFHQIVKELDITPENVAYLGDDLPDLPLLKLSGISVAPSDADEVVKESVQIVTQVKGGEGVLRELANQIITERKLWPTLLSDFE